MHPPKPPKWFEIIEYYILRTAILLSLVFAVIRFLRSELAH